MPVRSDDSRDNEYVLNIVSARRGSKYEQREGPKLCSRNNLGPFGSTRVSADVNRAILYLAGTFFVTASLSAA